MKDRDAASTVALGLNRWPWHDADSFARSVADAEAAGLDWAYLPVNPLGVPDPYVLLAAAARSTTTIGLGTLLDTPRLRSGPVLAGSLATLAAVSMGRVMATYGVGDTAVRWIGERPATVAELEAATTTARHLLAGGRLDAAWGGHRLRHSLPAETEAPPVWVAAGGPRTLRMAGRVADGVFIRAGRHPRVLAHALATIAAGAREAGRDPAEIRLGAVVHTVRCVDSREAEAIARAMTAGFHQYSPALFAQAELAWDGPPVAELAAQVRPDFHHASDLVAAGDVVSFLPESTAQWFCFVGTDAEIADQFRRLRSAIPLLEVLVAHPVPNPVGPEGVAEHVDWMSRVLGPHTQPVSGPSINGVAG